MNKKKSTIAYALIMVFGAAVLAVLDQWTKYLAVLHLKGQA